MPQPKASAAANDIAVRDAASRVLSSFVSEEDIDPDTISSGSEVVADPVAEQGALPAAGGGAQPQADVPAIPESSLSCASAPAAVLDAKGADEPEDGGDPALDSDFVYEEGEHSALQEPEANGESNMLLHRFAALTGIGELRAWFDGASDGQLLSLVHSVRELYESELQAQARLINDQVKRNLQKQSQLAVTLASELTEQCEARSAKQSPADAEAIAKLERLAAEQRAELEASRERSQSQAEQVGALEERLQQMEQALLAKDAEAKQLTEELQHAILINKDMSEEARTWKRPCAK